jgi:hypothetical protein
MKSSKVEVLKRVEEVFKLRLGGAEFADIREYALAPEQAWGVSDGQLWRYIQAADKLIRERFDARAEHLLNRHLLQRRTLYAHAMGAGDFRTALAVLQDEAKLEGLYPATRTELTGKDGGTVVLHVVEEVVGRGAPAALPGIVEEVVTHDGVRNATPAAAAAPDGPPAPGPARLPPQ